MASPSARGQTHLLFPFVCYSPVDFHGSLWSNDISRGWASRFLGLFHSWYPKLLKKHCHPAALSIGWQAYVLSLLTVASDYSWALVFCCLACLGTAWHSLLSYSLYLLAASSWNLGPLPDCVALPLDQLIAWRWLPTDLSICWTACIASLLSFRSDCTWALAFRCPVSCSECLASPCWWAHLLTLRNCSSAAWLFGTALSTCWMSGVFLLPFHLLLDYSVPLLLFESAYSLILALLLSCPLAFMPGISIISSCPPA